MKSQKTQEKVNLLDISFSDSSANASCNVQPPGKTDGDNFDLLGDLGSFQSQPITINPNPNKMDRKADMVFDPFDFNVGGRQVCWCISIIKFYYNFQACFPIAFIF